VGTWALWGSFTRFYFYERAQRGRTRAYAAHARISSGITPQTPLTPTCAKPQTERYLARKGLRRADCHVAALGGNILYEWRLDLCGQAVVLGLA
jgi:hypothetical protein